MKSSEASQFQYTAVFASTDIHVINNPSEEDKMEAKASLSSLYALLPPDSKPEEEPDLLYVVGNLAVGGMINKNDDGLTIKKALEIYKRFEKRQCNIEHNRKQIVGYIVKAGLSEFETNRVITEEEALTANKPFNIATVAILWRVANRDLCEFIEENADNPNSEYKDDLSLSFEVGFNDYSAVLMPKGILNIGMAEKIISPNDKAFSLYDALLRANGGMGYKGDFKVARILEGDVQPLGQGIVAHPAAEVKSISPIFESSKAVEVAIPDGVTITPASDLSNDNNNNKETCKAMKIKLPEALSSTVLERLALHEKSNMEYAPASVVLTSGEEIKDVKLYGCDYVEVTYSGDLDGIQIKDVSIQLPLVQVQSVVKRACDVKDAEELAKMLADIMETLKGVQKKLSV